MGNRFNERDVRYLRWRYGSLKHSVVDGRYHIDGDVRLRYRLSTLECGVDLASIGGSFICCDSKFKSMVGGPEHVGTHLTMEVNSLETLDGSPETVGGSVLMTHGYITNLHGMPTIGHNLILVNSGKLRTLNGLKSIGGSINLNGCYNLRFDECEPIVMSGGVLIYTEEYMNMQRLKEFKDFKKRCWEVTLPEYPHLCDSCPKDILERLAPSMSSAGDAGIME